MRSHFTQEESDFLFVKIGIVLMLLLSIFLLLEKQIAILENKKTDASMNQVKDKVWLQIMDQFNLKFNTERTLVQLKDKWLNMKKKAKKASADQRKETFKTGGGVSSSMSIDNNDEKVLSLIADQIKPLPNQYDSDRAADFDQNIEANFPINSRDQLLISEDEHEAKRKKLTEKQEIL